jgi:hypothetical protein
MPGTAQQNLDWLFSAPRMGHREGVDAQGNLPKDLNASDMSDGIQTLITL